MGTPAGLEGGHHDCHRALCRALHARAACASGRRSMKAVVVLMTPAMTAPGMVAFTREVAQYRSYGGNRSSRAVLRGSVFA